MAKKVLSFIIPVYNEENTLEQILAKVLELDIPWEKEIVIVNDCSTDSTPEILQKYKGNQNFKILDKEVNLGKSQTVKRGILASTGDYVVIQDADLEYRPEDLKLFVEKFSLASENFDVVYGNRFGRNNKIIYLENWLGNSFLSFLSAMFTGPRNGMWTRDMEVCYKMAKGDIFREIAETLVSTSNFGFEPEITAKFSKYKNQDGSKLIWTQVPVYYDARTIEEGKHMKAFRDGIKALWEIIKFNVLR